MMMKNHGLVGTQQNIILDTHPIKMKIAAYMDVDDCHHDDGHIVHGR